MGKTFQEYTTVEQVRELSDTLSETDDPLILSIIQQVSRDMQSFTRRNFLPRQETMRYDVPTGHKDLPLEQDLLSIIELLNGDGVELVEDIDFYLLPYNSDPKNTVRLGIDADWAESLTRGVEGAIQLDGLYGYHSDIDAMWSNTDTLGAALDASSSAMTTTLEALEARTLIRIEDEMLMVSDVSGGSIVGVTRGINGSTAATHDSGKAVEVFQIDASIARLCANAVHAYYLARANPIGEAVTVDGQTFQRPKDIGTWLRGQLEQLRLVRMVFV